MLGSGMFGKEEKTREGGWVDMQLEGEVRFGGSGSEGRGDREETRSSHGKLAVLVQWELVLWLRDYNEKRVFFLANQKTGLRLRGGRFKAPL